VIYEGRLKYDQSQSGFIHDGKRRYVITRIWFAMKLMLGTVGVLEAARAAAVEVLGNAAVRGRVVIIKR